MAMDLVMELVREAARDANVDAFAPHDDMATFARERDYNDWLARSYGCLLYTSPSPRDRG